MKNQVTYKCYDDWVNKFIEKYSKYCISIYSLGNVSYPGLSDVDLIVIPKKNKFNFIFFDLSKSSMNQMPFLLHNPFLLLEEDIDLLKMTNFDNIKLIYGKDLLSTIKYENKFNILLLLESFYSMKDYFQGLDPNQITIKDVPVMSSLRFTLKLAAEVLDINTDKEFGSKMDVLRKDYFTSDNQLNEIYLLFKKNILFLIEEMNFFPFKRSHIFNAHYYLEYGLSYEDVFMSLKVRNRYTKNLNKNNFDYGSLLRSSFYPQQKLSFPKRLLRKMLAQSLWKK